jgi:hypothetical protein
MLSGEPSALHRNGIDGMTRCIRSAITLRAYERHLAREILRLLDTEAPAATLNDAVLLDWVAMAGFAITRDRLRTAVRKLEETGLVQTSEIEARLVVRLTADGTEVTEGRRNCEGVARPDRPRT